VACGRGPGAAHRPHRRRRQDLIDTLALDDSTREAYVRASLGSQIHREHDLLPRVEMPGWDQLQDQIETALLAAAASAGVGGARGAAELRRSIRALPVRLVLNDPEAPLSETESLVFDYVSWIRNANPDALRQEGFPDGVERPLRAPLLDAPPRVSDGVRAVWPQILVRQHMLAADELWEHELVGVMPQALVPAPTPHGQSRGSRHAPSRCPCRRRRLADGAAPLPSTIWERLDEPVPGVTSGEGLGRFLAGRRSCRACRRTRRSTRIAPRSPRGRVCHRELERLFSETLDVLLPPPRRMDTATATKRLRELRARTPRAAISAPSAGWRTSGRTRPRPARRGRRRAAGGLRDRE
jgi:hypothetical protein